MTRVPDSIRFGTLLSGIYNHKREFDRAAKEVSSGKRVFTPSDSVNYPQIVAHEAKLQDISSFKSRIESLRGYFAFVEENLAQANNVLVRAKEIAVQAANETLDPAARERLSHEVFALRDHLVRLANSTYQGQYIWGGADSDDPPFDALTYTVPASGPASQRYVFDAEPGTNVFNKVKVSYDFEVTVGAHGGDTFSRAIGALERLGRALAGYSTNPPTGLPNGTGSAYSFPADYPLQTQAIRQAIDLLEEARANDIGNQRTIVGSKMTRLDIAEKLITMDKDASLEFLAKERDSDIAEAATRLTRSDQLLQASYQVLARISRLSLIDFI